MEFAGGEVVEARVAEEAGLGGFRRDVKELFADNDCQLAFPVEVVLAWWDGNGLAVDGQGGPPAGKDVGMLWHFEMCFLGMRGIIQTSAEHAGRVRQWRNLNQADHRLSAG